MAYALGRPCCFLQHSFRPGSARSQRQTVQTRSRCCSSLRAPQLSTVADPDEGGGTSTIERPDLLREGSSIINLTDAGFGNVETKENKKLGGGNYRVILLDDPKHTEELVVHAITTVLPGTDVNHAKNCFSTSRELGAAIIISCLKEHAEFYGEQIFKKGCRTKIEPDTATI